MATGLCMDVTMCSYAGNVAAGLPNARRTSRLRVEGSRANAVVRGLFG